MCPFAEVKDFIRQKILQEKQTEMVQKYIEDLKKGAKIVINEGFFKEEAKQGEAPAKAGGAGRKGPCQGRRPGEAGCERACGEDGGRQGEMKRFILIGCALLPLLLPGICRAEVADRIVAIVNDEVVTLREVERFVAVEKKSRFSSMNEYMRNMQIREKLDAFIEGAPDQPAGKEAQDRGRRQGDPGDYRRHQETEHDYGRRAEAAAEERQHRL